MVDAEQIKLVSLAEFRVGYPFRGAIAALADGPVYIVQIKDISAGGVFDWDAVARTELPGRREPDWLDRGDVLFVARGNRYYAAALEAVPGRVVCGPHLYHLRLKRDAGMLPGFLAWQLNQLPIQRLLRRAAEGSNQLSIRRAELEILPISVPPLAFQQKILRLTENAARERALLDRLIANRERLLSALAIEMAEAANGANG